MLLGLEAYYIRDWRTLQMVAYLPLLALLVLWWLVPESPRYTWISLDKLMIPKGTNRLLIM